MLTLPVDDSFSPAYIQQLVNKIINQANQCNTSVALSIVDAAGVYARYHCMDGLSVEAVNMAGYHAAQLSGRSENMYSYGKIKFNAPYAVVACLIKQSCGIVGAISVVSTDVVVAQQCIDACVMAS